MTQHTTLHLPAAPVSSQTVLEAFLSRCPCAGEAVLDWIISPDSADIEWFDVGGAGLLFVGRRRRGNRLFADAVRGRVQTVKAVAVELDASWYML